MGYPFNLFYLSCCASSTTLWCFRFDSTNSNSSIFFAKHCPKKTEVKKLPVKFFLLSHQGTRWPWGMFVQRFRANASCVFQGKIQGGLFHFLTKQEAFIWNEWNNSTAHVVKCATNKEQRKYGLTERRFTKIFRFFHAQERSRKLRDKFGKWS